MGKEEDDGLGATPVAHAREDLLALKMAVTLALEEWQGDGERETELDPQAEGELLPPPVALRAEELVGCVEGEGLGELLALEFILSVQVAVGVEKRDTVARKLAVLCEDGDAGATLYVCRPAGLPVAPPLELPVELALREGDREEEGLAKIASDGL